MTATNINIGEFMKVLQALQSRGHSMIDLDMLPDENHPSMNKLVIHPVYNDGQRKPTRDRESPPDEIKNPEISTENNDIFSSFDL